MRPKSISRLASVKLIVVSCGLVIAVCSQIKFVKETSSQYLKYLLFINNLLYFPAIVKH
jgi:hypothetical protein